MNSIYSKADQPDISSCTAKDLHDYIKSSRTPAFVKELLTLLSPSASLTSTPSAPSELTIPTSFGNLLHTLSQIQCITPRGRFDVSIYEKGIILKNSKGDHCTVPPEIVSASVLFAKPDLYTRNIDDVKSKMLLLVLESEGVKFKKGALHYLCFQAEMKDMVSLPAPNETTKSESTSVPAPFPGPAPAVYFPAICTSVSTTPIVPLGFLSSKGLPFVQSYKGTQEGVLYPMTSGILFFKPPHYIPRSTLVSIAAGRGGSGGNATRFVDMVLALDGDQTLEFTNIDREELAPLNHYIKDVLTPAMARDAAQPVDEKVKPEEGNCVFEVEVEVGNEGEDEGEDEVVGRRPRRAAAKAARVANRAQVAGMDTDDDDDEDDEDVFFAEDCS